jgi:uncharacterized 2Fe-2S/4Fe-4S cluster protein (DUF4445 family)
MLMVKIHLLNENKIIECESGINLYEVLSNEGFMDAPCGGTGLCGKCKVRIESQEAILVGETQAAFFTPEQIAAGWRLACLCEVKKDMTVELPRKSQMSNIVSQGYMKKFVHAPGPLLNAGGNIELHSGDKIATVSVADSIKNCYGVAVDIGTTTVVASLVDLNTGKEIESLACLNGQKAFGQDVISRIHYADSNSRGTEILQKTIIKDLRNLLIELCRRHNLTADNIYDVSVAANTTMIHLLAGINPASMGKSPYVPAFQGALSLNGRELGLPVSPYCDVYCLPAVSSFVGGDITAGVLACGLESPKEKTLFIDIGTNGEIVLADGERFCSCSCAAGPALEGMNITCGVRAAQGAIEDVFINGDTVQYTTIGGEAATGICGSGLLAAIAEMRRAGIINKSGRLQSHALVETVAGKKRFIIHAGRNIYLTQQDIRQVQLAKGAILSGIYALLEAVGMKAAELHRVIVAGQFGAHLKVESLVGSGLLPAEWSEIISYAGNTSKSGALICLLSQPERTIIETLAENIQYIELSELKDYENLFVKCMQFQYELKGDNIVEKTG